jgi:hypothetical protein
MRHYQHSLEIETILTAHGVNEAGYFQHQDLPSSSSFQLRVQTFLPVRACAKYYVSATHM